MLQGIVLIAHNLEFCWSIEAEFVSNIWSSSNLK